MRLRKTEAINIDPKAMPKAQIDQSTFELLSTKPLGSFVEDNRTSFRLFAPNAARVFLHVFNKPGKKPNGIFEMSMDKDGVWEACIIEDLSGKFYAYKVLDEAHKWDGKDLPLVIDPYAKAVATYTDYMNPRLSIVYDHKYDWEDDTWMKYQSRDLIIYETHVKDMTAHPTSGVRNPGTYKGLTEKTGYSSLSHLKDLGINAVELLPTHEFSYFESPYKKQFMGKNNTWNPYEENHWGYMTANYFSPAAKYSEPGGELIKEKWIGTSGKQVSDFKDMVKAFHKEGIAVIMDVVFNHISEYEITSLQSIDKDYYLRKEWDGKWSNESWCGNDLASEHSMVRRLIKDSIIYWMTEYHVDGFRFDLGKIIDFETLEEIIAEAKKINPYAIFIAEPWGGGYDPTGFSLRGWTTWNDQIRNGIKGENPYTGKGWIFGRYFGGKNKECIQNHIMGSLLGRCDGLYHKPEYCLNYLESHDGYTLGDFIRIALQNGYNEVTGGPKRHSTLNKSQMRLNKLAALFLMASQGMVMIHEGQEYARSKIIKKIKDVDDPHAGKMDHNSYDKDNETNYINYDFLEINKELVDYYKGLIKLRKKYFLLRNAEPHQIKFHQTSNNFSVAFSIFDSTQEFKIIINASEKDLEFDCGKNFFSVLVNADVAGTVPLYSTSKKVTVPSKSGYVLYRKY